MTSGDFCLDDLRNSSFSDIAPEGGLQAGKNPNLIQAVVFDLDGVLIDSEHIWDIVKKEVVEQLSGAWRHSASMDMMGMSPKEWPYYMQQELGLGKITLDEIRLRVLAGVKAKYEQHLPLIAGASNAVRAMAICWRIGLASSSDRTLIDLVLDKSDLRPLFTAVVASEEVDSGKPAPDVYLEVCHQLSVSPTMTVAVEDSASGIISAKRADMLVVAIPQPEYAPSEEVLAMADIVLDSITELSEHTIRSLAKGRTTLYLFIRPTLK
jgi:HAD superfamily hydrolase (TIGR01509 family)